MKAAVFMATPCTGLLGGGSRGSWERTQQKAGEARSSFDVCQRFLVEIGRPSQARLSNRAGVYVGGKKRMIGIEQNWWVTSEALQDPAASSRPF